MGPYTISLGPGRVLSIDQLDERFPLGKRGQRPVHFVLLPEEVQVIADLAIPGVSIRGGRVSCTWDAALIVARSLDLQDQLQPYLNEALSVAVPLPGKERYRELELHMKRRGYQAEAIAFLARRAYAIEGDIPRAGKCLMTLATLVLVGSQKTLILGPALSKYVWAEEIWKWTQDEAAILFGQAEDEIRVLCTTCLGRASIDSEEEEEDLPGTKKQVPCPDCKAKNGQSMGERIYFVRELQPETGTYWWREEPDEKKLAMWREKEEKKRLDRARRQQAHEEKEKQRRVEWEKKDPKRRKPFQAKPFRPLKKNQPEPPPKGQRRGAPWCKWPGVFRCTQHPEVISDSPGVRCRQCEDEMNEVLRRVKFIICNYDIITAHKAKDLQGSRYYREDLPGWGRKLAQFHFDACLADECFVKGTLVGGVPIEEIQVGDLVPSFDEDTQTFLLRKVTQVFVKPCPALVRLYVGDKSIVCTPDHLFFTSEGWKPAKELSGLGIRYEQEERKAIRCSMRRMRQTNPHQLRADEKDSGRTTEGGVLLEELLSSDDEVTRKASERGFGNTYASIFDEAYEGEQPYAEPKDAGEAESFSKEDRAQTKDSGWEWERSYRTRESPGESFGLGGMHQFCGEDPSTQTRRPSVSLQDRHRRAGPEAGDRGGWEIPQHLGTTSTGSEKGGLPTWARVDRVEVLEPGGDGKFGGVCPEGVVYDLEVEGTHTYLVEGVVVHNCHRIGGYAKGNPAVGKSQSRRERCCEIVANIERVYGISGTPSKGLVRHYWGVLDFISGGLWS